MKYSNKKFYDASSLPAADTHFNNKYSTHLFLIFRTRNKNQNIVKHQWFAL